MEKEEINFEKKLLENADKLFEDFLDNIDNMLQEEYGSWDMHAAERKSLQDEVENLINGKLILWNLNN